MTTVAKFAAVSLYGGCVWETFGSAGLTLLRSANPHTAATPLFRSRKVALLNNLKSNLMTIKKPLHHYAHMSHPATDHPVLLINADAPLRDLHACLAERLNAVLKYLDLIACTSLPDYAEHDINTVTNIARIMVQDVSDVFRVIEQRGFEANCL